MRPSLSVNSVARVVRPSRLSTSTLSQQCVLLNHPINHSQPLAINTASANPHNASSLPPHTGVYAHCVHVPQPTHWPPTSHRFGGDTPILAQPERVA
ncbi:hypothetical protein K505DRAFT_85486 [Melanomma pulvis-pyrius CBS 109.77]|uniref:Uncharacterized protein n=1 Tax=Melanomma pulvis-pyrius CBS 109.77 TaxID=1314802 RepID=A0A6A6XTB3_9PLEO|nr:hypothetical protein K505DRAFT_85486 [Melanomma pulvis-pyrius CBS 109.77]